MPPTAVVVTDQAVTYRILQSLLGLDAATFRVNLDANNNVVFNAVASSVADVSADNILLLLPIVQVL